VDTRDLARTAHRDTIRFEFQRRHPVLAMSQRGAGKSNFGLYGDQVGSGRITFREYDLRTALAPLETVMPRYPAALAKEHPREFASVNFVVASDGRVRVPGLTDAIEPEFGEAALAAVRQWRFAPPLQHGTPVQVMVDRTFRFGGTAEKTIIRARQRTMVGVQAALPPPGAHTDVGATWNAVC
jgi:TonB family protein